MDPSEPDHNPQHAADMAAMLKGEPHPYFAREGVSVPVGPPKVPSACVGETVSDIDVCLRGYLTSWIGYGQLVEHLGKGLSGRGYRVGYADLLTDEQYLPRDPWVTSHIVGAHTQDWSILAAVPSHAHPGGRLVRYTQWESSYLGVDAVDKCNQSELILVPGSWQVETFRASGVTTPIEIVHQGIDPSVYFDDGSPLPSDVFRVGLAGRLHHGGCRKGVNEGIRAFLDAFPGRKDVELVIKCFADDVSLIDAYQDDRIKVVTTPLTTTQMADWYRSLSMLLVPSKGEGWGLQTHQAMAVGRPVAVIPWSGTTEFWHDGCGWAIDYSLVDAGGDYRGLGQWAEPRHESMVALLRHAYDHRDECIARGKVAASRASEFTWDRTGRELESALIKHGFLQTKRSSSPRPKKILAGTQCCRPEYTRQQLEGLKGCRGIEDYTLVWHVEPGDEEVLSLLESIDFAETIIKVNDRRLGFFVNTFGVIENAFSRSDYCVFLDDDIVFAPDALEYFEWARGFGSDATVFSATSYNRQNKAMPPKQDWHRIESRSWFHPWGWSSWKDRWERVRDRLVADDARTLDTQINDLVLAEKWKELFPVLGRSQNIGHVSSLHSQYSPEWYAEHHTTRYWAGGVPVGPGEWRFGSEGKKLRMPGCGCGRRMASMV